ncbi:MAG TPA: CRISPR-associated protein Cas4 [Methanolinea sp.]|jgi:CRISPR-associated exonuclease Cas4|nr:CRISPR-associated protein Cas4 [Methanolinea sp.]HPC54379.1 CRISPR-associated protein Cas4 [Methanolinea sp.]HQJ18135.1 CRISPR-associated protein Cas4 [Methanolinea sp.]HRS92588.1 CRISPR-associated protein Cas4 [Methanolinea sp.]HRU78873.1 CRISPR-associated protein Cas4 [Methanolinea sp.]
MIKQLSRVQLTGTQINYYFVCPTKLWLFSHNISQESSSELVGMGKFVHESSYSRENKNIIMDRIGIDFFKKGEGITIHEIKKSKKLEQAHRYQLYYYIYYLQEILDIPNVDGLLDYPLIRKRERLMLTDEVKKEIERILLEVNEIVKQPQSPPPIEKPYCRKCAYFELCWV